MSKRARLKLVGLLLLVSLVTVVVLLLWRTDRHRDEHEVVSLDPDVKVTLVQPARDQEPSPPAVEAQEHGAGSYDCTLTIMIGGDLNTPQLDGSATNPGDHFKLPAEALYVSSQRGQQVILAPLSSR